MFLYIYNDILSMFQPGHVAEPVGGSIGGITFNQAMLFSAAALMTLPGFMVLLSLILKAGVNRIVNIVFGFFYILVLVATQFMGETDSWVYWRFYEALEALFLVYIIWTAWRWPTAELIIRYHINSDSIELHSFSPYHHFTGSFILTRH
ncbi:MAG: hypothetical protein JXB03_09190 [Spirochaetales bacterium]|nr:hypothetical protein [Spirochaetales bacterium]